MTAILHLTITAILLGSIVTYFAPPIASGLHQYHHHKDEICKKTTLYPLTSPPQKGEKMILCHPIGKALAAANNSNLQFNAGEMAAQNQNQNQTKCPIGHTKDFCNGWRFANNGFK